MPGPRMLAHTPTKHIVSWGFALVAVVVAFSIGAPPAVAADGAFVAPIGGTGSEAGRLSRPWGVAVDRDGSIYVADGWNHRIQKYSATGTLLAAWGTLGSGPGEFHYPRGIAVDSSGNVYVADAGNSRIQKFSATGTFLGQWGLTGGDWGQFMGVSGVAVDAGGDVYVLDSNRVQKFSSSGAFITGWGGSGTGDGQFGPAAPWGIAVDRDNNVYVTQNNENCIQKFSSDGAFLMKWDGGSAASPLSGPSGISIDPAGNLYVAQDDHRVQKFSPTLALLATWGGSGAGDGQFNCPSGVAVDAAGNLFVADMYNDRIQKLLNTTTQRDPGDLNDKNKTPAVVLVNGWLSGYPGDMNALKRYLEKTNSRGDRVYGTYDVVIAKCGRHATDSDTIDTEGGLDENVSRFANWLGKQDGTKGTLDLRNRPIIIIGHSMGGLIARGLVSTGAEGRLSHTKLAGWDIPKHVVGVVQLASPNEGSALAAALNDPGADTEVWASRMSMAKSDATWSLAPRQMSDWNSRNAVASVPIQRGAGLYLPTALDEAGHVEWQGVYRYLYSLQPDIAIVATAFNVLDKMDAILGRVPSDGVVTQKSAISKDIYFDGGGWLTFPHLSHGKGVAGDRLVLRAYIGTLMTNEWLQHEHQNMIPSPDPSYGFGANPVFDDVLWAIRNPGKRWGNGPNIQRASSHASLASPAVGDIGSRNLPPRVLSIPFDGSATYALTVDGTAESLTLSSVEATPVVVSLFPEGSVDTTLSTVRGDDGTYHTVVELDPRSAGELTIQISLDGASGSVKVTGQAHAGPSVFLDVVTDAPTIGRPVHLRSRVESAGVVLTGGSVVATMTNGADEVAVSMSDDGVTPDTAADDGVFAGQALLDGAPGRWSSVAEASGWGFQREAYAGFSAGSSDWAKFSGSIEETTTAGAGDTIARWGITAPIQVSEPGTYTVVCDVTDSSGELVAQPSSGATLSAGTTTLVTWVEGEQLSAIKSGALKVTAVRLSREAESLPLSADATVGPTTRAYDRDDFEDFSLDLTPAFSNPTASLAPSFRGTARYTPGSVSAVEYSLDGGANWDAAAASDGAFDARTEGFDINLSPGEGLFGILVRSSTSDGRVLAESRWGAVRFIVDAQAPSAVNDLSAIPDLFDAGVTHLTWLAPESASATTAIVGYEVSVDLGTANKTYDTGVSVQLPDLAGHTVRIRAVDEAGNTGPYASVGVGDAWSPTTICDLKASYVGSATVTLTPSDVGTGLGQTLWWLGDDESAPTSGTVVKVADAGLYTLHYLSIDNAGNREDTETAVFTVVPPTYTIAPSAGAHGSMVPGTAQTVESGGARTFTITPTTGYHIAEVSRDSVSIGASSSVTFDDVTANHTINAVFAIDTHSLTYIAGLGGSIEGSAIQIVDYDTDGTSVTAKPAPGYHFVKWLDGVTANPRTDTAVTADKSVLAVFAIDTRNLTYTAGIGGSVEGAVAQVVDYNSSGTAVTAKPATGYHFVNWSDGVTANPRTDTAVTANTAVSAIFAGDAPVVIAPPVVRTVTRLAGAARWDVAANLARKGWDPANTKTWAGVKHVIITNGENGKEADPLAAAGVAGAYNCPVLLTGAASVPAATKTVIAEIARKNPGLKVHLIGGTASVPDARWNDIKRIKGVSTTKDRIAGANRYDVSANVANRIVSVAGVGSIQGVILVAADNPAAFYDALAASPIAYANRMPMLSVKKGSVPPSVSKVLKSTALKAKPRYAASSAAYIGAGSLSGATRLTTSASRYTAASQIANKAIGMSWTTPKDTGLAAKLPDALTGGTYLGKRGGVMLFTPSSSAIQSVSKAFITANKSSITNGWVIGGTGSVPAAQETSFRNLLK